MYVFSSYDFEYDESISKFCIMRKKWFDKSRYVRESFKKASEVLMYDFSEFFNNSNKNINTFLNTQIVHFVFSYAMFEHLSNTYKLTPDYFMGFGFGEVAALCAAGVISFNNGLKFVNQVSNAINAYQRDGGFVEVVLTGVSLEEIAEILKQFKCETESVKAINSNYLGEIIISGKFDEICCFLNYLKPNKKLTQYFYYNYYNNEIYNDLIQSIKKAADQVSFNNINFPVMYSSKNRFYNNDDDINKALTELFLLPVSVIDCIVNLSNKSIECCIDVSPNNMIKMFAQSVIPEINFFSVLEDKKELTDYMNHVENNILTITQRCIEVACTTKNSNKNLEEYKKGVLEPYLELEKLCNANIRSENIINKSLDLLEIILKTKGFSVTEINSLINDIVSASDCKNPILMA